MAKVQNSKVLLVEDDKTMQSVLRTLLELEGFSVTIAPVRRNQVDLIGCIKDEQPDVMLLDYHLGNVSGLDLLQQVRQEPSTARTRVIMTSGLDVRDRCMEAGADDFLLKPFMPEELIQKLKG